MPQLMEITRLYKSLDALCTNYIIIHSCLKWLKCCIVFWFVHWHLCVIMMTSSNRNIFHVTGHLRYPVNSPHKGQWALMFSLICVWINDWVNNREAGDLRHNRAHCNDIDTLILPDIYNIYIPKLVYITCVLLLLCALYFNMAPILAVLFVTLVAVV